MGKHHLSHRKSDLLPINKRQKALFTYFFSLVRLLQRRGMSNKQPCFAQTVMIIAASLTIHPQGLQQNNRHRKAPQDNCGAQKKHHAATILTILLGTTITFLMSMPATWRLTFSNAKAAASTSLCGASFGISIVPRILPQI